MVAENSTKKKMDPCGTIADETILKIAKEITVKFIEVGRITPATFAITFSDIYSAIDKTVHKG